MDDQTPNNQTQTQPEPTDYGSERRANRSGNGWIGGAVLIAVGIILLLQNMGNYYLNNWWALFILIPAVGAFSTAWRAYQESGNRLTSRVRGSLFGGSIMVLITFMFLFNLNWTIFGPILLVLAGAGLLVGAMFSDRA
jgi:hypothetical protein